MASEGDSVIVGRFAKPNDWHRRSRPRFLHPIAQRYFDIAPLADGLLPNIVYLIGGKAAGFYTRLSAKSTDYTAVTAPTFVQR
ncbi:MAG: hypothetical protein U0Y68_04555 [Blastocatellia bacterium]